MGTTGSEGLEVDAVGFLTVHSILDMTDAPWPWPLSAADGDHHHRRRPSSAARLTPRNGDLARSADDGQRVKLAIVVSFFGLRFTGGYQWTSTYIMHSPCHPCHPSITVHRPHPLVHIGNALAAIGLGISISSEAGETSL